MYTETPNFLLYSVDGILYWKSFSRSEAIPCFQDEDGFIFSADRKTLLCCSAADEREHYDIPEGTVEIDSEAFEFTYIRSITLPSTLEIFRPCEAWEHIDICHLKDIYVNGDNAHFTAVDGVLYSKDVTRLVYLPPWHVPDFGGTYTMPHTVKEVCDFAVWGTVNINKIFLSRSLEKLHMGLGWPESDYCTIFIPEGMPAAEEFMSNSYLACRIYKEEEN